MKPRDRIKALKRIQADQLRANPRNWRTHSDEQKSALRGLLEEVGIADACLVRELDDGTYELIDGHLRQETLGGELIPCLVLDVDQAEADKLLATLDPLAGMAGVDSAQLDALLREIETASEGVANLISSLATESGLLEGEASDMPLKPLETQPPPALAWVLVGIPTVRFGLISETVEALAAIEGTIVHTTVTSDGKKDR